MQNLFNLPEGQLAFSVRSLSAATSIGETMVWEAVKSGEIKTRKLIIGGKGRVRRVIMREAAIDWLDSFPDYDESAA